MRSAFSESGDQTSPSNYRPIVIGNRSIGSPLILRRESYYVSIEEYKSKWTSMTCGVPQGSILAPLLFSLYMLPLSQIMRKNQIAYHSYANDTQIYLALSPNNYSPIDSLCQCIDEINSWMCQNFLQLNKEKTEVIAFGNKDEVLKVNAYLDSRSQTNRAQR